MAAEAVRRISTLTDYYEILGINRNATAKDIKQAYKRLALQVHPDRNNCVGATQAFQKLGKVVSVLSDPWRRSDYNVNGPEEDRSVRSRFTFERADADEIFKRFFGGNPELLEVFLRMQREREQNLPPRNRNQSRRTTTNQEKKRTKPEKKQTNKYMDAVVLVVLLIILLWPYIIQLVPARRYTLERDQPGYPVGKKTPTLGVTYFVKDHKFFQEFRGSLYRFETRIEEEYISNLKSSCREEMNDRDWWLWKARNFGDRKMFKKAHDIILTSCEKLYKLNKF